MPEIELEIEIDQSFENDTKTLEMVKAYAVAMFRLRTNPKSVQALINAYLKGIMLQEDVIKNNKNIENTESKKEKRKRRQKATNTAMEYAEAKNKDECQKERRSMDRRKSKEIADRKKDKEEDVHM